MAGAGLAFDIGRFYSEKRFLQNAADAGALAIANALIRGESTTDAEAEGRDILTRNLLGSPSGTTAVVATTPDTTTDYADVDYTGPVAVAVGAEKVGLDAELLEAATHRVRIPMAGRADSLNVATSAAIAFYEAQR